MMMNLIIIIIYDYHHFEWWMIMNDVNTLPPCSCRLIPLPPSTSVTTQAPSLAFGWAIGGGGWMKIMSWRFRWTHFFFRRIYIRGDMVMVFGVWASVFSCKDRISRLCLSGKFLSSELAGCVVFWTGFWWVSEVADLSPIQFRKQFTTDGT